MVACLMGHAGVVELLIAAKADIEGHSLKEDSTPLMLAASKGRSKCVDVLIRNGARVNANTIVSLFYILKLSCYICKLY